MNRIIGAAGIVGFVVAIASAQPFDHLACSKVKDPAPRGAYTASLIPSGSDLPVAAGCLIKVPAKQLCVDVQKAAVTPPPPGAPDGAPAQRYLCYKTKCPKQEASVAAADQFGSRVVEVRKLGLLCAPLVTTTTTSSTTTSTSLPAASSRCCEFSGGCFDGEESFVTPICLEIGTFGDPGEVCNGATGTCAASGSPGQLCCDCPNPDTGFCMEGPIVPLGDVCDLAGCTALVGYVCDDVTHDCRLP
jgi:hypothetical protein